VAENDETWRGKTRIFGLRESQIGVAFLRNDGAVGQAVLRRVKIAFSAYSKQNPQPPTTLSCARTQNCDKKEVGC